MAQYTINFHDRTLVILHSITLDLWEGNRDKTNRRALAIAETVYAYLTYQDTESLDAMWLAIGNDGEAMVRAIEPLTDWSKGAVTIDYLLSGRTKTACFCMDREIGDRLIPGDRFFQTDATKAFGLAM